MDDPVVVIPDPGCPPVVRLYGQLEGLTSFHRPPGSVPGHRRDKAGGRSEDPGCLAPQRRNRQVESSLTILREAAGEQEPGAGRLETRSVGRRGALGEGRGQAEFLALDGEE